MNNTDKHIKDLQNKILQKVHRYETKRIKRKQIIAGSIPLIILLFFVGSLFVNNLNENKAELNIDYIAETMDDYDLYAMAEDNEITYNEESNDNEDCEIEYLANDPFLEFYLTENN